MDEDAVRDRLARMIEADGAGYAALSRMLRRNAAYLQQYVRRGTPRVLAERDRTLLARYFGVGVDELGGARPTPMAAVRRLDVAASAGPGAFSEGDPEGAAMLFDPRLLDNLRLRPASAAVLRVRGDSMEPTIADGDTIVADESDTRAGATPAIFVLRCDGVLVVKRVSRGRDGLVIVSDNPAYPPLAPDAVDIVGRVVWLGRALR